MVNLILLIHCHQPVGNFDKVFVEAFEKSYLPFIEVLEKHPTIKLSLHYSGSLLDWLCGNRPEFIKKLRTLVKNGQVEIFSGGYYEPILTLIPENDALGQIELLHAKIKELFSFDAKGAWIAERVWEPKLPQILAKAKLKYGVIDDSHFRYIGVEPETLNGFYATEEAGFKFNVFPGSEKLRYLWPFKLPEESIDYLRNRERNCNGNLTVTFGDDGEKFGLWPGTHKWVYQEGWLNNFFRTLEENSSWIKLSTFKEHVSKNLPTARAYLPCASYREMMEWSEGFYRNFMVKYPEANNMHKKMLYVSSKINSVQAKEKKNPVIGEARRHLYMGQANDSYWHGIFGGIYLNHLRFSAYHHLIEAQNLVDKFLKEKKEIKSEILDFDCDGKDELFIDTKDLSLCLRPAQGASLSELDYKPKAFNLINTLARREEHYHKKIKELIAKKKELKNLDSHGQPSSIHNLTQVKDENLDKILFYDRFPRYCLLDHFLSDEITLDDFLSANYRDCADFSSGAYSLNNKSSAKEIRIVFQRETNVHGCLIKMTKSFSAKNDTITVDYLLENISEKDSLKAVFGVEFNFSSFDDGYSKPGEIKEAEKFILNDKWNSVRIEFALLQKANLWHFPVETVSESETGIEKSCQEICLLFWRKLNLLPKTKWQQSFKIKIST